MLCDRFSDLTRCFRLWTGAGGGPSVIGADLSLEDVRSSRWIFDRCLFSMNGSSRPPDTGAAVCTVLSGREGASICMASGVTEAIILAFLGPFLIPASDRG
jgi:hypothetical protein